VPASIVQAVTPIALPKYFASHVRWLFNDWVPVIPSMHDLEFFGIEHSMIAVK